MNTFVPARFSERVARLAVGLELIDAARSGRVGADLRVALDDTARGLPRPRVLRHNSGLHSLLAYPKMPDEITLRVFDAGLARGREPDRVSYDLARDRRRFVPRRFTVPLPLEAKWANPWDDGRGRRPRLFPGAGYDVPDTATAMRGRVLKAGKPVRWVRVEARAKGIPEVVARAHGDDRGEFLLLLPSLLAPIGDPGDPIEYDVVVFGLIPASGVAPLVDPLGDLPVERFAVSPDGVNPPPPDPDEDPVARGEEVPADYVQFDSKPVTFEPGRAISRTFSLA